MNSVLRAILVYFSLLIIFRIAGKRTLSEATTFDFILLLIIGEAIQPALLGEDNSLTNAFIIITTLISIELIITLLKMKFKFLSVVVESIPLLIVNNGELLKKSMKQARVEEEDILEAARELHGLERLDQIKYAILEVDGKISIIPKEKN